MNSVTSSLMFHTTGHNRTRTCTYVSRILFCKTGKYTYIVHTEEFMYPTTRMNMKKTKFLNNKLLPLSLFPFNSQKRWLAQPWEVIYFHNFFIHSKRNISRFHSFHCLENDKKWRWSKQEKQMASCTTFKAKIVTLLSR
jgi:hypothetical protein